MKFKHSTQESLTTSQNFHCFTLCQMLNFVDSKFSNERDATNTEARH